MKAVRLAGIAALTIVGLYAVTGAVVWGIAWTVAPRYLEDVEDDDGE